MKKPVSRVDNKPKFNVVCLFADISNVDVIEEYSIGQAKVFVTKDGRYLIVEPKITAQGHEIYEHMMEQLFLSLEPLEHARDPVSYIETHIWKEAEQQAILDQVKSNFAELKYYLIRDIVGYGMLDVMMNDDNIEEITAERFDRTVGVIHRKFTEFNILDSNVLFGSEDVMNSYIQRLVQRTGHTVTAAAPVMNAMTPTGDRITVTYEREVSLPGPTIDIRKFTRQPYTITHLLELGAMSRLMAAYLWVLFDAKAFGLIIGETGSGKTTTINSLMCLTNPRWKIVTIEETPELKIPHYRWERLFTRTSSMISDSANNYDITIMDLIKASFRMRPDFEIVGEVRGEEAFALFQSAATGHGGLCLPENEPLLAKIDDEVRYLTIRNLVNLIQNRKRKQRVSVISFDSKNNTINFSPVTGAIIKTGSNDFLEFRTKNGKFFCVHSEHPVLIKQNGKIITIPAKNVKRGDLVPTPNRINLPVNKYKIDVIELLKNKASDKIYPKLFVRGKNIEISNRLNGKVPKSTIWEWRSVRSKRKTQQHGIPIKYYEISGLTLDKNVKIGFGEKGRGYIPALLSLNFGFGYICGWYLSDGSFSRSSKIVFYPGHSNQDAKSISNALKKLGIKCKITSSVIRNKTNWNVTVHSTVFAQLISAMSMGKKSIEKKIPDIAFNAPLEFRKGLVTGYWMGDGHLRRHGKKSFMAVTNTISRDLAYTLHLLLKSMGIGSSIRVLSGSMKIDEKEYRTKTIYEVKILSGAGKITFKNLFPSLKELDRQTIKNENEAIVFQPINQVSRVSLKSKLYDIEVKGKSNFLHGGAVFTHNTSFHASGVESALSRLAAEPINIRASQQMLMWFVLHITRMRNEKKQVLRRVASLSEVIPKREGRVELSEIFRYDIKKNSFGIETPEELIKKSQRLQQAADLLNIDNLLGDLKTRMYLIEQCLKNNAKKIDDVFAILGRYYSWTK